MLLKKSLLLLLLDVEVGGQLLRGELLLLVLMHLHLLHQELLLVRRELVHGWMAGDRLARHLLSGVGLLLTVDLGEAGSLERRLLVRRLICHFC